VKPCIVVALFSFILLSATGCAGPQKASNPTAVDETQNPLRNVSAEAVHSLVIPPSDAGGQSVGKTVVIEDERLVQGLFEEIQRAPLQRSTHRLMFAPRPIIFLDGNHDVIAGFRYYGFARPAEALKLCEVHKTGAGFAIGKPLFSGNTNDSVIVPGLRSRLQAYVDLWE
jgi:hypothetical protein